MHGNVHIVLVRQDTKWPCPLLFWKRAWAPAAAQTASLAATAFVQWAPVAAPTASWRRAWAPVAASTCSTTIVALQQASHQTGNGSEYTKFLTGCASTQSLSIRLAATATALSAATKMPIFRPRWWHTLVAILAKPMVPSWLALWTVPQLSVQWQGVSTHEGDN